MLRSSELLVLNYTMDSSHPSLGHQFSVVTHLANYFQNISVLTTQYSGEPCPPNIEITVVPWKQRSPVQNAIQLFLVGSRTFFAFRPNYVFSHMAPLQSIVIGPLTRLFRVRHSLWYAHAHNPRLLRTAVTLVDTVISSTKGSFPFDSKKLHLIGQGVDSRLFTKPKEVSNSKFDFIYAGRMDTSKNVELIIHTLEKLKSDFPEIKLTLVGNSSNSYITKSNRTWVTSLNSLKREDLPNEFGKHGAFVHAFLGSLDKVLVEAVMMQMPVLSINPEFKREFLVYGSDGTDQSLSAQVRNYLLQDSESVEKLVAANLEHALGQHELAGWITRLINSIKSGE